MRLEVLSEVERLNKIRPAWGSLCEKLADHRTPFSSYEWYEVWWRHYSAGGTPHVIVMWDGGEMVGLAPFMLRRATLHGLRAHALCFIANNQSFLNDFVVVPGYEEVFLRQTFELLSGEGSSALWDVMVLDKLSSGSRNRAALLTVLAGRRWRWLEKPSLEVRHIIPSRTWEEFLAERTPKTRKTLRNIQNSMRKAGTACVKHIRTWDEFEEAWPDVARVARGSWTEGLGDSMASSANEAFFRDLARTAAERGWLSAWMLSLDGTTIAVEFHLRAYGREFAMRGHYLPEYAKLSPGTFLEMEILRNVFEDADRVSRYELGDDYPYKTKWSDHAEPRSVVTVFNERLYSRCVAFHEMTTVPFLRKVFPQRFWGNKFFRALGIHTEPFRVKQR